MTSAPAIRTKASGLGTLPGIVSRAAVVGALGVDRQGEQAGDNQEKGRHGRFEAI